MFVLTVDQRHSRRGADLVEDAVTRLSVRAGGALVRPFERTSGDEFQGLLDEPSTVVELALDLVRTDRWSIGIGTGPTTQPLPASTRAGSGAAFEHARDAVTRAKRDPQRLGVGSPDADAAQEAEVLLRLLAAVVQRRSEPGWEAIDLVAAGQTQTDAAQRLGITKQAISQRLHAAMWPQERAARPLAAALLKRADVTADAGADAAADAAVEATANVAADLTADTSAGTTADATADATSDATSDATADSTSDATSAAKSAVTADLPVEPEARA